MRGLGIGQSVVFLIPPEVSQNMRGGDDPKTSIDVIRWALVQTCDTLGNLKPLWALQGLQHYKKNKLWSMLIEGSQNAHDVASCIQEPEAQSLSQLYDPSDVPRTSSLSEYIDPNDRVVTRASHDAIITYQRACRWPHLTRRAGAPNYSRSAERTAGLSPAETKPPSSSRT